MGFFQNRPSCCLAILSVLVARERNQRSYNAVGKAATKLRDEELEELNKRPEFVDNSLRGGTYKEYIVDYTALATACATAFRDYTRDHPVLENDPLAAKFVEKVVFKGRLWKAMYVKKPGIEVDQAAWARDGLTRTIEDAEMEALRLLIVLGCSDYAGQPATSSSLGLASPAAPAPAPLASIPVSAAPASNPAPVGVLAMAAVQSSTTATLPAIGKKRPRPAGPAASAIDRAWMDYLQASTMEATSRCRRDALSEVLDLLHDSDRFASLQAAAEAKHLLSSLGVKSPADLEALTSKEVEALIKAMKIVPRRRVVQALVGGGGAAGKDVELDMESSDIDA